MKISARNWGAIAKRVSAGRRVVAVDMRNHGQSPWDNRHTYGDQARVYGLKENELIEHGIYRRSRNPQYLGYWLMFVGAATASGSLLAFLFAVAFALLVHGYITIVEEPHLKRHFGADYTQYCRRVGRYFHFGASSNLRTEPYHG